MVQVTEMDKAILIAQIVKVIVDVLPGLRHLVGVGKTQQIVRAHIIDKLFKLLAGNHQIGGGYLTGLHKDGDAFLFGVLRQKLHRLNLTFPCLILVSIIISRSRANLDMRTFQKLSRVNQALIVSLSRFPCQEIRCGQINRIDAIFGCQNIGGQVPIPNVAVQLNQRTQRIIKWVKLGAGAIDIDSIQADPFHLVKILSYRISEIVIAHQGKFHGYFLPKITAYGLGGGSAQGQIHRPNPDAA